MSQVCSFCARLWELYDISKRVGASEDFAPASMTAQIKAHMRQEHGCELTPIALVA